MKGEHGTHCLISIHTPQTIKIKPLWSSLLHSVTLILTVWVCIRIQLCILPSRDNYVVHAQSSRSFVSLQAVDKTLYYTQTMDYPLSTKCRAGLHHLSQCLISVKLALGAAYQLSRSIYLLKSGECQMHSLHQQQISIGKMKFHVWWAEFIPSIEATIILLLSLVLDRAVPHFLWCTYFK